MIKWGIIGAGWIADKMASDFCCVENAKIVAVAARDLNRAEEFAHKYKIEKAYGNYQQLATDPDIDVVYIATTHNLHLEHTMLCLQNNKHVLCEKPITVNANEFAIMRAEAQKRNLFLMEAFWTNFLPTTIKALEWVKSGVIGNIELITANLGFIMRNDPQGRFFNPALAAGSLLDLSIYNINFGRLMAQSPVADYNIMVQKTPQGIDLVDSIQVRNQNNILGLYTASSDALLENNAIIMGTKGRIVVKNFHMSNKALLFLGETEVEEFIDERTTNGYNYEAQAVTNCLLNNQTECQQRLLNDTDESMKLMDDMRKRVGIVYPFE